MLCIEKSEERKKERKGKKEGKKERKEKKRKGNTPRKEIGKLEKWKKRYVE
jgi:hypothetical protein